MYIRHFLHVDSLLVLSGDHQGTAKEFLDVCSETGRQLTERDAEKINCPLVHKQYQPAEARWNQNLIVLLQLYVETKVCGLVSHFS